MKSCKTLYIIDDDDTYQFIAERTIAETGLVQSINVFPNGQKAIDFIGSIVHTPEVLPDMILLDLTMPVMDGWTFLEQYVTIQPRIDKSIYIYIVSSSINPSDVERAKNISAVSDYIVKPITGEKFISLLQN